MGPGGSMPHSQGLSSSEALCDVSEHPCFYSVRLLASRQTPQAGGILYLDIKLNL